MIDYSRKWWVFNCDVRHKEIGINNIVFTNDDKESAMNYLKNLTGYYHVLDSDVLIESHYYGVHSFAIMIKKNNLSKINSFDIEI